MIAILAAGCGGEAGPELLARPGGADDITVDDQYVYWTHAGWNRLPKTGGEPTRVEMAYGCDVQSLEDDGLYCVSKYLDPGGALMMGISRFSRDGSDPVELAGGPAVEGQGASVIAVDGEYVYWTWDDGVLYTSGESVPGSIYRVARGGGAIETLAQDVLLGASGIAIDDDYVYVADEWAGWVIRLPKAGGDIEPLVEGLLKPQDIKLHGGYLYVAQAGSPSQDHADGSVIRLPKQGGPIEVLAANQGYPRELYVDDRGLVWMNWGPQPGPRYGSGIFALEDDGSVRALVSGVSIWDFTADETHAYWISFDWWRIYRIER